MIANWLWQLIFLAPAVLIAVTFHEYAHGATAYLLGDPTAKKSGRLSLNPLRHLDPLGTIMLVVFRFGWGRPVPVDSRYFRQPRWGMVLVSLAGPATNFLLAAVFGLFIKLGLLTGGPLASLFLMTAYVNIVLGVFNLLPLPPLDGSRLVAAILPGPLLKYYQALEGYGIAVIFVAVYFFPGILSGAFTPFIEFFRRLFLV